MDATERETPVFGPRERESLVALVSLWEATGEPQSYADIARHLRSPVEFVWSPINVCRGLRLVWLTWPRTSVTEGYLPLVLPGEIPEAQPYPAKQRRRGGKLDTKIEKLREGQARRAASLRAWMQRLPPGRTSFEC